MPDLADLPTELFSIILAYALNDNEDPYELSALSLLSRKWYAALIHRIYSDWTFNDARQPFMTLWRFLTTVLRDPHLAAQVRTLRIGNWGLYPEVATPGPDLRLPAHDLELIRGAIHKVGIADMEATIVDCLPKRDRRPLMALLLTCLPNLSAVFAHVPRSDPFLAAVLKRAVERQNDESYLALALCALRDFYLCQEPSVDVRKQPEDSDPDSDEEEESSSREALRLDYLWPVFTLRNLRTLSLIDFDTDGAAVLLGSSGTSTIEYLFLVTSWKSVCTFSDVEALINKPQALKSFTCNLHNNPFDHRRNTVVSNAELGAYLERHQLTLETIDIMRSRETHRDENGHFGRLSGFQKLKNLRIQSAILLGGCCDLRLAPFHLKDTLPPTIETLSLYGEEGFHVITDLPAQLEEVVSAKDLFPVLSSIFLDDEPALFTEDGQWPRSG
ncbi:hypothetical protein BJX70DRAFT_362898 [Aspergillus crustosus]